MLFQKGIDFRTEAGLAGHNGFSRQITRRLDTDLLEGYQNQRRMLKKCRQGDDFLSLLIMFQESGPQYPVMVRLVQDQFEILPTPTLAAFHQPHLQAFFLEVSLLLGGIDSGELKLVEPFEKDGYRLAPRISRGCGENCQESQNGAEMPAAGKFE